MARSCVSRYGVPIGEGTGRIDSSACLSGGSAAGAGSLEDAGPLNGSRFGHDFEFDAHLFAIGLTSTGLGTNH